MIVSALEISIEPILDAIKNVIITLTPTAIVVLFAVAILRLIWGKKK